MGSSSTAGVLFAVPAWNEEQSVGGVVEDLLSRYPESDVVVVDDGSADGTGTEAVAAGAVVLTLPFNVGVGGAMRTAFLYARRLGYPAVIQVDADGQHDPQYAADLLAALADADVVVGSRFAGEGAYEMGGPRRLASRILARALSRMTGSRLTDTTSGFRAAGPRAIALFAREYPAEYLGDTVDSLVIAAGAGLRIAEVPVAMRARQAGDPSQGFVRSLLYLGRAVLALTISWSRQLGSRRGGAATSGSVAPHGS